MHIMINDEITENPISKRLLCVAPLTVMIEWDSDSDTYNNDNISVTVLNACAKYLRIIVRFS